MTLSTRHPSPSPPLSRASLVVGLYAAMALVGLLIAASRGNPDLYGFGEASGWLLLAGPVIGVAFGIVVVLLTRLAARYFQWARDLHTSFRDLLGSLTGREIVILAVASSVGEELLFRGALMPWLGLPWQALVFALLHVGPSRRFLPWTASAFVIGVALGLLAEATGNLGAPIAAHFTVNFVNLRYIVAREAPGAVKLPPATSAA